MSQFSRIYSDTFDFVKLYRQNRTSDCRFLDMSIMFLIERLLCEVLQNIDVQGDRPKATITTTNRLYLAIQPRLSQVPPDCEVVDQFLVDSFQLM
jgi:hypothetical protein